ncbi:MAG: hypothetical protein AAGC64_13980, partial [Bacteroidota bacterium]
AAGIKGTYQGKEGFAINETTGNLQHYRPNGTIREAPMTTGAEVTIYGNPIEAAVYQGQDNFINHPVTQGAFTLATSVIPVAGITRRMGSLSRLSSPLVRGVAKSSTKLLGTARDNLLNAVKNPKLKNIVNDLYRPGAKVGNGSSMDAFRLERLTGGTVSGKSHHTKLLNYRKALQRVWGNRSNLSPSDRQITKQLLQDIQNALSGY